MVIKDIIYFKRWNKLFLIAYIREKYIQIAILNFAEWFSIDSVRLPIQPIIKL